MTTRLLLLMRHSGVHAWTTWNPSDKHADITLSNGNKTASQTVATHRSVRSVIGKATGTWFWEVTVTALGGTYPQIAVGTATVPLDSFAGAVAAGYAYLGNGQKMNNNSAAAYGSSWTTGDVVGVALDMGAGTVVFYKNGVSQGTAYSGLTGTVYAMVSLLGTGAASTMTANFGASPFAYTPPAGVNRGLYA